MGLRCKFAHKMYSAANSPDAPVAIDPSDIDAVRAEISLALIRKAAKAVDMSEIEFLNAAFEIAYDPYTEFLYKTWGHQLVDERAVRSAGTSLVDLVEVELK